MKKEQRDIYLVLARQELPARQGEGVGLCNLCRYGDFSGDCEDGWLECKCGIWKIEENSENVWQGADCWAFRPRYALDDTVDMIGLFLQGLAADMSNCKEYVPREKGRQESMRLDV